MSMISARRIAFHWLWRWRQKLPWFHSLMASSSYSSMFLLFINWKKWQLCSVM